MRLRTRYALVLFGVSLVLGVTVVGSTQLFQQQTQEREQRDVEETAQLAAQQIDESLDRELNRLDSKSSVPPANLSAQSGPYLQSVIDDTTFDTAILLDRNGTITDIRGIDPNSGFTRADIIGTDESDQPYFRNSLTDRTYIADPTVESDGRVTLVMSARILQNGTTVGVLAAALTAYDPAVSTESNTLFNALTPLNTTDQTARIIQPTETGDLVMSGSNSGFEQSLTSRAQSDNSGWIVEVERDRSVLLTRLDLLQTVQFVSLFVVVVSIFGLGYYEYRTNLQQTRSLLDGFDELTAGNFEHTLALTAATEWRQIGDGFNEMADGIADRERRLKNRERQLREREQRLSVLNRVLRHNLQNEMTVIQGHAELLPEFDSQERIEDASAKIIETSQNLVEHGKKARRLEQIMEQASDGPVEVNIAAQIRQVLASYKTEYPGVTIHTSLPEEAAVIAVSGIEFGIESLIENAFEHNDNPDPEVWISVDAGRDVTVEIRDNGSGIPEHEQAVLNETESSLEHGSGIGLWLAYWAIEKSDGDLRFGEEDPSRVCVTFPAVASKTAESPS